MELLVGMYGELIATLAVGLAAMPFFKKTIDVPIGTFAKWSQL